MIQHRARLRVSSLIMCVILSTMVGTVTARQTDENEGIIVAVQGAERDSSWEVIDGPEQTSDDPLRKLLPGPTPTRSSAESIIGGGDTRTKKTIAKMVGGLAIVVALFIVIAMVFGKRKHNVAGQSSSPIEILCRSMLNKSQQMQLIRLGNRLLLVASSEHRADTLAEIVDPAEIAEIEQMVRQGDMSFFGRARQQPSSRRQLSSARRQPVYEA